MRVFKVMFTAIITAMLGVFYLSVIGYVDLSLVYSEETYIVPQILGGLLLGFGFVIGGYCPGTSVVGFVSGKIDGLVFFIGLALGTFVFAGAYDVIEPILEAVPGPEAQTVPELLHLPTLLVLFMLLGVLVGVGWMTRDRKPAAPVARGTVPVGAAAQTS